MIIRNAKEYVRSLMIEYEITGFISHEKLEDSILIIAAMIARDAAKNPLLSKELESFVSSKTH